MLKNTLGMDSSCSSLQWLQPGRDRSWARPRPIWRGPSRSTWSSTTTPDRATDHPLTGDWRNGDDLEAWLIDAIDGAKKEVLVAVQELSLPKVAQALIAAQQRGVHVAVVLENNYSQAWSKLRPSRLNRRGRQRWHQLNKLADQQWRWQHKFRRSLPRRCHCAAPSGKPFH